MRGCASVVPANAIALMVGFVMAAVIGLSATVAEAKKCGRKGGRLQVYVKARTPLRRGPGLNYGVATFLEDALCAAYSEVSLDEQWVLIEVGTQLGWVPASRLGKASRRRVKKLGTSGPVGSGQSRSAGRMLRQSVLLERPELDAPVRRVLPENLRVLPIAVTRDGRWTQIRDERGDVGWVASADVVGNSLDKLPRTDDRGTPVVVRRDAEAVEEPTVAPSAAASVSTKAPVEDDDPGVSLRVAVFGAALNPVHSLDSDGANALRRYDLSAFSPGTGLDVEIRNLGPVAIRLGYTIAFLSGVSSDDVPDTGEAGGLQHDAYWRIGVQFDLGGVQLTPELGYHLGMFDFDTVLSGQQQVVFLSTQSHAGTAGLRLQAVLLDGFSIDVDAGALLGVTQESPQNLGDPGLTVGFAGQVGGRVALDDTISIVVRYAVNYRTTDYSGEAQLDPSITEATLVDLTHGLLAGVAFDL